MTRTVVLLTVSYPLPCCLQHAYLHTYLVLVTFYCMYIVLPPHPHPAPFILCTLHFASWMDPSLEVHAQRLEHPTQYYPELQGEVVTELKVSALFTVAVTQNKRAFWW